MRWNPRRRRATNIASTWSGKVNEAEKPSPWNSLEVAKIIVGALTPLLIGSIGIYATWQSHRQDVDRAAREDLRARKSAAQPIVLDLSNKINEFRWVSVLALSKLRQAPRTKAWGRKFDPDLDNQEDKVTKAGSALLLAENDTLTKLRILIDDDAKFDIIKSLYSRGIVDGLVNPATQCVALLTDDVRYRERASFIDSEQRCANYYIPDVAYTCESQVEAIALNFEKPIADRQLHDAKNACSGPLYAVPASDVEPG